jgi:dTDP-4-amino-4,6-dideoxygalactose transaminase
LKVPFIDLKAQYFELKSSIDRAVDQVMSNAYYTIGPYNQLLEKQIAELHGTKHAIAVNSGTDALRIALEACGIKPGDEVITTAFTFVATIETIIQVGAIPVMVDIDPATFNIDPACVEAAITPRTKAIMPVHLFGQIAEMEALQKIAREHGLVIIEDAAQAIGSQYKGKYAGQFGKAAALSFYVTKNLGAAGDGGMILTDDEKVHEISCALRVHGMGRQRYYYDYVGYTSRLAEIQAAILCVKLSRLEAWNQRRAEIASMYNTLLADTDLVLPETNSAHVHTWHQYTVRSKQRDELQKYLRDHKIDTMIYYPVPLNHHAPYKLYGPNVGELVETERAAREVLSLPIHPHLTDEQVHHVATHVREFSLVSAPAL